MNLRRAAPATSIIGSWNFPCDDTYFTQARAFEIDHLVPLAEAWDSGASTWSAKEREAYANDLDDARALIAVSAASNRPRPTGSRHLTAAPLGGLPYWSSYLRLRPCG